MSGDDQVAASKQASGIAASAPSLSRRIGQAKNRFDKIRLDYAPQQVVHDRLEEIHVAGVDREPGAACSAGMLVAAYGVGKTEALLGFADKTNAELSAGPGLVPILIVIMDTSGTVDSVPSAILAALRQPRPDLGKPTLKWLKAIAALRDAGVQLIIFDEFNRAARRPSISSVIADEIREKIMDSGIAPVVFVGSKDALVVLRGAPATLERVTEEIDLEPMDWLQDKDLFVDLVTALDQRLVSEDLTTALSGFDEAKTAEKLWEACSGRIRRLMNIVRLALGLAMTRGSGTIGSEDLDTATDEYAVRRKYIESNPFSPRAT